MNRREGGSPSASALGGQPSALWRWAQRSCTAAAVSQQASQGAGAHPQPQVGTGLGAKGPRLQLRLGVLHLCSD